MNTLESPIEALAFHNLSFFISALARNIWAWLAAVTAAASYFWRLKADNLPATAPSRACTLKDNATSYETVATPPSPKFTANYAADGGVAIHRNACYVTSSVFIYDESSNTITGDYCGGFVGGEDWLLCDEPVVACYEPIVAGETKTPLTIVSVADSGEANYDSYWNGILMMRNGDGIGRCRYTAGVLDGNVVKLWDRYSDGCIPSGI